MKLLRFFAAAVGCSLAVQVFAVPQNDAAKPKRLHIEPEVAAGLLKQCTEPAYPESALADHVSGDVLLRIVIDQQGKVIEAAPVSRDEWPANPVLTEDARLREAALDAVKYWKYHPYLLNGQPVEAETQMVVKFRMVKMPDHGGFIYGRLWGANSPPPQYPARPQPERVSAAVMEGNLLKHVDPVYPAMAGKMHIQGEALLQIDVSKDGTLSRVKAISGHPLLTQSAVDAVKQWEYKPFQLNGDPVEVVSTVRVTFKP
jgi:TonB family protein